MRSINLIYSTDDDFKEIVRARELSPEKQYLVRVHTCVHTKDNIMSLVGMIRSELPACKVIGSSTSSVIFEGQMMSGCCMISITDFDTASISTCLIGLSGNGGKDYSGRIIADRAMDTVLGMDSRFMLAFFARPFTRINSFVERINEISNVQIIGGIANTLQNPNISVAMDAFVFDNGCVSNNAAAIAVISSRELMMNSNLIYATEPVGTVHTITEADGMIIREIDGEDAVSWYQKQLGMNFSDRIESDTTILFPLVRVDFGDMPWALSYSPQRDDIIIFPDEPDPLMFVPSEAKAGEHIRIAYTSVQKTVEVCEEVCGSINDNPAEVLFGYSCISRMDMFKNCAEWELLPFADTNMCGALVAGELGSENGVNRYCNYSFAIAALAEKQSRVHLNTELLRRNSTELVNSREHIVDYLIAFNKRSGGDDGLSSSQRDIQDTLFTDDDTGLPNATKYSYDLSLGRFNKICMITFRNEILINAFMSKSKFRDCFKAYYREITGFISDSGYSCYIYRRASLLITASPSVCDAEFIDKMRALQEHLSDFKFGEYIPVSEFSLVGHEDDLLSKAEMTLESMRRKKSLFMLYTEEMGLDQVHAKKLKMLLILNDAIANDRVTPFFQGIRDNSTGKINMYESLMRIEDSSGNIYTPYRFMDTAKDYGYYNDISFIMISKVLEFFRNRPETVTMNLSISDLSNYKIVHHILEFLHEVPDPERFVFEITESEEIEDYQLIAAFVEQIHQSGGKVAIDDFGSGFSNIVNILKINSDYIKIDGEIVRNILNDPYALEFLEMFSDWANRHDKDIIAEFTETAEIQELIEKMGIRYSQGYLFSKPDRELCGEQ